MRLTALPLESSSIPSGSGLPSTSSTSSKCVRLPSVTRTVLPAVSAAKFSRVWCSNMPWSVMSRKEEECGWKRAKVAFGKRHLVRLRLQAADCGQQGSDCRMQDAGCRAQGAGCRWQAAGLRCEHAAARRDCAEVALLELELLHHPAREVALA